jgi:hypothetical protein
MCSEASNNGELSSSCTTPEDPSLSKITCSYPAYMTANTVLSTQNKPANTKIHMLAIKSHWSILIYWG